MEFFQNAIKEKLDEIERERIEWTKQKDIHLEAEKNLIEFPKSFQLDCLVPIGAKALMPGKLYHTNEIMIGHPTGLFSKCSAHKALEVCRHRLKLAEDRLSALDVEWQMYHDRSELPFAEDAFADAEGQREIIEVATEEEEQQWREKHKKRMAEHKEREAAERAANANNDTDYLSLLDRAMLEEELANELENMNVENDADLHAHLAQMMADQEKHSLNGNGINLVEPTSDLDTNSEASDSESNEFDELNEAIKDLSPADKHHFYKQKLRQVNEILAQKKVHTLDDLNEKLDKSALRECLQSAIHRLDDIVSTVPTKQAPSTKSHHEQQVNGNEGEHDQNHNQQHTSGYWDREKFSRLEQEYVNRSKSEQLVFYKGHLRSALKLIASSAPGVSHKESEERRLLYEYLSNRIDHLRSDVLKEKQAQIEERFVDDNSDNENGRKTDDDDASDADQTFNRFFDDDMGSDAQPNEKRRISFANQPMVTTYNQDDEPWCIHTTNDESMKTLMDKTFQFFNDDEEGDDDDEESTGYDNYSENASNQLQNWNATNIHVEHGAAATSSSSNDGRTLLIQYEQSPQTVRPIDRQENANFVRTPADIYRVFANGADATIHEPTSSSNTDLLKNFVKNVANLDMDDVTQRMKQLYAINEKQWIERQQEDVKCDQTSSVHELQLPGIKPIKSILKNREAVQMETHRDRTLLTLDEKEVMNELDNVDEQNHFVGFDTIVGEIVENRRVSAKSCPSMSVNDSSEDGVTGAGASSVREKPLSLFKRSRK